MHVPKPLTEILHTFSVHDISFSLSLSLPQELLKYAFIHSHSSGMYIYAYYIYYIHSSAVLQISSSCIHVLFILKFTRSSDHYILCFYLTACSDAMHHTHHLHLHLGRPMVKVLHSSIISTRPFYGLMERQKARQMWELYLLELTPATVNGYAIHRWHFQNFPTACRPTCLLLRHHLS